MEVELEPRVKPLPFKVKGMSRESPLQKASHVLDSDLKNHWSTGTNTKEWILLELDSRSSYVHVSSDKTGYATMKQPEIESSGIPEIDNGEYWPLSGKPSVDLILTKTSVKSPYGLYLPRKMNNELPPAGAPAVLTCGQKRWDMFYGGVKSNHKFSNEWRNFVEDNNLKEGDGLVFELSECSVDKIHFRVQILRGDFPAELMPEDEEGANSDNPIILG